MKSSSVDQEIGSEIETVTVREEETKQGRMARVDRAHFQYPSSGSGSGLHNGDTAEYCNTMREVGDKDQ